MTSLSPLQIMLIPSSFIALSGVLALTWQPSHRMRSLIQHFAVGVILAVLSTDVFPEIAKEHAAAEVLIGSFALGGFFMYLMKKLTDRWERQAHASGNTGTNIGLISTTFIDAAIDGLIIGTGLAANTATGLILAVGLSVEMLFLGLSLMSAHALAHAAEEGIAVLAVEDTPVITHWQVVHPSGKRLTPLADAFLRFLQARAPELNRAAQARLAAARH